MDVSNEHGLGIIARHRTELARNGRQYGGVAIAYWRAVASFEEYPIVNPDRHEVLAAIGKIFQYRSLFTTKTNT